MQKLETIQIGDQEYLIDYSGISARGGSFIILNPEKYKEFKIYTCSIPLFLMGHMEWYVRDGILTESGKDSCKSNIPEYTSFFDAFMDFNKEQFRKSLYEELGKKHFQKKERIYQALADAIKLKKKIKKLFKQETALCIILCNWNSSTNPQTGIHKQSGIGS